MTLTDLTLAGTGVGNANPTWSFNLASAQDFSVGMQYIDQMHSMRPWLGHRESGWGGMEVSDLQDGGYLDKDGWPTEIPEGMAKIGTVFGWTEDAAIADQLAGRYVIKYEGEGALEISGDVNIISRKDGEIVFDNVEGDKWFLNIIETDPAGNGNYIRDISVVAEEHVELHEAGALFNPAWLELIEDSRELRLLNWMGTNGSEMTSWDEMPSADGPKIGTMTPIEHMVQLANETGTDPWFTMPHLADDDFIRQFAEYVRDNLDPALTVRVEYSNEMWNWNFPQTSWARDQSVLEWGEKAHRDYYVKKSVETAQIWQEVFGEDDGGRLLNVIATQNTNPWFSAQLFDAATWRENEPDTYVDPATVFDELAVTTYFGNGVGKGEQLTQLLAAIKDPAVDANAFLYDQMMDPAVSRSIPEIANFLAQQAAVAQENGVALVAYEGGQHMHHQIRDKNVSEEDRALVETFMEAFVASEEMADLYAEIWDVWANISDGSFMQFTDTGASSKWGTWGLYEGPEGETPRSELLEQLSASSTPWWETTGGEHYQQGKIVDGTDGNDTLIGTSQEDYLLGSDGDDILVGGAKNDGLHGGAGNDRAVFSGVVDDYVITVEGDGYRVTGPDGSDLLVSVEQISFEDNTAFVLADQPRRADGVLLLGGGIAVPPVDVEAPDEVDDTDDGEGEETTNDGETPDDEEDNTGDVGGNPNEGQDPEETDDNTEEDDTSEEVVAKPEGISAVGNADHNTIYGEETNDDMSGGGGDDVLFGDAGDDRISGNSGKDTLYGGDGDDALSGGTDDDILEGGNGNDTLSGNSGNDLVFGDDGDDVVSGGGGDDILHGDNGDDHLSGQNGNDVLYGGNGEDDLFGGAGDDILEGGSGSDHLRGNDGDDVLSGGTDDDILEGGNGNDTLSGNSGNDQVFGNDGDDAVFGGGGDDILHGDDGDDHLSGQNGNDVLYGGSGEDDLFGGGGDDILAGGAGNDHLRGGNGADKFSFEQGDGVDTIHDFSMEDELVLSGYFDGSTVAAEDRVTRDNGNVIITNGVDTITVNGAGDDNTYQYITDMIL